MKRLFFGIPLLARQLSGGSHFYTIQNTLLLWYFVLSRKFGIRKSDFIFNSTYKEKSICFYLKYPMDIAVLYEIFVKKEYDWFPIQSPETVIDLGGHYGDTALYYNAVFPQADIYTVEASPDNFRRLEKHVANNANITPINTAVSGEDGAVELVLHESSLGHSLFSRSQSQKTVTVSSMTLGSLAKKYGIQKINILKFDIEGAEFSLLKNLPTNIEVQYLIGELHYDLAPNEKIEEIEKILEDYKCEIEPLPQNGRYLLRAKKHNLSS